MERTKDYSGKRANHSMSQESFVAARKNKIEYPPTTTLNADIIDFILQSEIETFKQVKNLNVPSNFLDQPFGHHAFNRINPQRLMKAKKTLATRKYLECTKIVHEITTKVGTYRTVYGLIRENELDLLVQMIRVRHMLVAEQSELLSICYEELRAKNVPIASHVEDFIQKRLISCKCEANNNRNNSHQMLPHKIFDRIKLVVDLLTNVKNQLQTISKRNSLISEKTLADRTRLNFQLKFILENLRVLKMKICAEISTKSPSNFFPKREFDDLEFYTCCYLAVLNRNLNEDHFDNIYLLILNDKRFYEHLFKFANILKEFCYRKMTFEIHEENQFSEEFCEDVQLLKSIYYLRLIHRKNKQLNEMIVSDDIVGCLAIERFLFTLQKVIITKIPSRLSEELMKSLPFEIVIILKEYNIKSHDYDIMKRCENLEYFTNLKITFHSTLTVFNYFLCRLKYQLLSKFIGDTPKSSILLKKIFTLFSNQEIITIFDAIDDQNLIENLLIQYKKIDQNDLNCLQNNGVKFWNINPIGLVTDSEQNFKYVLDNFERFEQVSLKIFYNFHDLLEKFDKKFHELDNGQQVTSEIAFQRVFELFSLKFQSRNCENFEKFQCFHPENLQESEKSDFILKQFLDYLKIETERVFYQEIIQKLEMRNLVLKKCRKLKNLLARKDNLTNFEEISQLSNSLGIEKLDEISTIIRSIEEDFHEIQLNLSGCYENRYDLSSQYKHLRHFFGKCNIKPETMTVLDQKLVEYHENGKRLFEQELKNYGQIYEKILCRSSQSTEEIRWSAEMLIVNVFGLLNEFQLLTPDLYFLDDYSPVLYGDSLYKSLIDFDPVFEQLLPDSKISIFYNLDYYLERQIDQDYSTNRCLPVGVKCEWSTETIRKRFEKLSKWIETQIRMFDAITNDDLFLFREQIEKESDLRGISLEDKSISQYFYRNKYLTRTLVLNCSKLHLAVLLKQNDLVSIYAKKDINVRDRHEKTALHYAVDINSIEIIKILLAEGARIDAVDSSQLSPFHYVIIRGNNDEIFDLFMEKGGDPYREINNVKLNGFIMALILNHKNLINKLSKNRDQIRKSFNESTTITIFPVVVITSLEMLKIFINSGLDINRIYDFNGMQWTLIHCAAFFGIADICKYLIRLGADLNILTGRGENVIHLSTYNGNVEVFKMLIEEDVKLLEKTDKLSRSPFEIALLYDNGVILQEICKMQNQDPPKFIQLAKEKVIQNGLNDNTDLHMAVRLNSPRLVESVIETENYNIDHFNEKQETALHLAIKNNNYKVLKILLDNGANVNLSSDIYLTPLALSCLCKNSLFVKTLLQYGANPNYGHPLHFAIEQNQSEICRILIEYGMADVNLQSTFKLTPLHLAVIHHRNDIIKLLLKFKAYPNAQLSCTKPFSECEWKFLAKDYDENVDCDDVARRYHLKTPLHFAIESNNIDGVKMLVTHGASVNRPCSMNRNPLNLAKTVSDEHGCDVIRNYLIRNGAIGNQISVDDHLSKILENSKIVDI